LNYKKHILASILLLSAGSLSLTAIYNNEVVKEHGLAEGVDQAGHYIWGFAETKKNIIRGKTPCDAIQTTIDLAIKREFYQKAHEKKLNGGWCGSGCKRDLKYWFKGIIDASSFKRDKVTTINAYCDLSEWNPPQGFGKPPAPLLNIKF
jgi:hypothetical protein